MLSVLLLLNILRKAVSQWIWGTEDILPPDPDWLTNFRCTWTEAGKLTMSGFPEDMYSSMRLYLAAILPKQWPDALQMIMDQEDHSFIGDTEISFSCNWSAVSSTYSGESLGSDHEPSGDCVEFYADPFPMVEVPRHQFLRVVVKALEHRPEGFLDTEKELLQRFQEHVDQVYRLACHTEAQKDTEGEREELESQLMLTDGQESIPENREQHRFLLPEAVPETAEDKTENEMSSPTEVGATAMENLAKIKELERKFEWLANVFQSGAKVLMPRLQDILKRAPASNTEDLFRKHDEIKPVHQQEVPKATYSYREDLSNLARDTKGYKKPLPALKMASYSTKQVARKFHPTTHGSNVHIEYGGLVARSDDSSKNSICFSELPIKIGEKIHLKTIESRRFKGATKIGFTSKNPDEMTAKQLPMHSYPNLNRTDGFWIKPLPEVYGHNEYAVTFCVDDSGNVFFSINGDNEVFFFDGVDVSMDLWAVVDIHGSAVALQFEDEIVQPAPREGIREGDHVMLTAENMETLRVLQDDHGDCPPDMEEGIGKIGIAREIDHNEDVTVYFPEIDKKWRLSPAVLQTVENVGSDFVTSLEGICEKVGHHWKMGLSRVCTQCGECTSKGEECIMKGLPLRPLGSTCGCRHEGKRCANCGLCRTCAGLRHEDLIESLRNQLQAGTEDEHLKHFVESVTSTLPEQLTKLHKVGHDLTVGDQVKVQVDEEAFEFLQKESGCDWKKEMIEVIGRTGEVTGLVGKKAVTVNFSNGTRWDIAPDCLIKTSPAQKEEEESLKKGDLVKVLKDEKELKKLQIGHGGYNEKMNTWLGKTGRVRKVRKQMVQVEIAGQKWWFNRAAVSSTVAVGEESGRVREGDFVKVVVDEETFRQNQIGHGGQGDKMKQLVDKVGMVHQIDLDGDAVVYYADGIKWTINPLSLDKVNPEDCDSEDLSHVLETIEVGDWVKVDADKDRIKEIQERTVPWNDGYYDAAGHVGRVDETVPSKNLLRVSIQKAVYPLNTRLLKKATVKDMREAFAPADTQCPVFARGDLVKICTSLGELKSRQHRHGGYTDRMEKVMASIGSVRYIDGDGDVHVKFSLQGFCFSPDVLSKVERTEETFHVGDMALIEPDRSRFVSLQKDSKHGGYVQGMVSACGKIGRLLDIIDGGRIRVKVDGTARIYCPDLLERQGNPGLDRGVWKSTKNSICAPGSHDWSKGRCLVCVNCGECTQYGKQCPIRDRSDSRDPGSICGCGFGHAGCDDCGYCKTCANEDSDSDSDDQPGAQCKVS